MSLVKTIELKELNHFFKDNSYLSIVKRDKPKKANFFFKELITKPLSVQILVKKNSTFEDIKDALIKDVQRHIGTQKTYDDITLLILKQK